MRKVFSSIRLENAEGVATLLNEHGIQTRITNGRSYKGSRRRGFSYRESALLEVQEASVWIVLPDDQPRARALLRAAGLMDSTRDSFLPESPIPPARLRSAAQKMARVRLILLAAVVILMMLSLSRSCQQRVAPPVPEPAPAPAPAAEPDDERHIVPVELSL